ncbi:hypothetical protein V8E54_003471 [Elaphomyces granulatus]
MVPRGGPALQPVSKKEELRAALEDLKHLLRRVSDQEKKYGEQLNINELAVIVPFLLLKVQGRGILLDAGSFSGRYRGFKIGSFHEEAKVVVEVPG